MGRKAVSRKRKAVTNRTNKWLGRLLLGLQHEDLKALTIDDLAGIAGKSKSTIYEYFASKEDILVAACGTRTNQLATSIAQLEHRQLPVQQQYIQLMEIFARGTSDISIGFLQSIRQHYPGAWAVIDDFINNFITLLEAQYRQGIERGIYNPVSVELLGTIDKLFITQVVTNPAVFSDQKYTLSNLVRDYLNLRLTGLLKR